MALILKTKNLWRLLSTLLYAVATDTLILQVMRTRSSAVPETGNVVLGLFNCEIKNQHSGTHRLAFQ